MTRTYYIITETSTGLQCGIVSDIRTIRDDPRFECRAVNARFQAAIDRMLDRGVDPEAERGDT